MRVSRLPITLVVVVLAVPTVLAVQSIRQQRITFTRGSSSATVTGTVKGDAVVDYVLGAAAGQTMSVTFKANSASASFNVLPPGSEAALAIGETVGNAWTGTLPVKGDYRVRVFLVRSAARRGATATYTLTVGIGAGGDAKVKGTPYHATGTVPCSIGPDPKESAQCSFGVIRSEGGRAEVYLASPGFDVTLHKDKLRILRFTGSGVTSTDASEKVSATKQGDNWMVAVNDFYFYTIPDAVIVGG